MPRKSVTISTGARLSWLFPFLLIFQATEPRSGSPRTSYCRWTQHGDCWPGHRPYGADHQSVQSGKERKQKPRGLGNADLVQSQPDYTVVLSARHHWTLEFFPGLSALGPFRRPGTGRRNVRADLGGAHFRAHYPHRQSRSTHDCRHHPVYDPAFISLSGSRCLLQGPFLIFMPRFSSMSSVLPGLGSAFPPFQRICSRYSFTSLS